MAYERFWEQEATKVEHQDGDFAVRTSLYVDQDTGQSALMIEANPNDARRTNDATPYLSRSIAEEAGLDFKRMEVFQTGDQQTFVQRDSVALGQNLSRDVTEDPNREREQIFSREGLDQKLNGELNRDMYDLSKESFKSDQDMLECIKHQNKP